MATKPTDVPRWADTVSGDPTKVVEPPSGIKDIGFVVAGKAAAQFLNWLLYIAYTWILYLQDLENQAITWTKIHIFQKGITVTQSTTNADAITATGNGTGRGINATGGAVYGTGGEGVRGKGGATNGVGVLGEGTGSGSGVRGAGDTAIGVEGVGGSSNGTGVQGTGGATNGKGMVGRGTGAGAGGDFQGGATGRAIHLRERSGNYANQLGTENSLSEDDMGGIDYLGFPAYQPMLQWRENWSRGFDQNTDGACNDMWYGRFVKAGSGAGRATTFTDAYAAQPEVSSCLLRLDTANHDLTFLFCGVGQADTGGIITPSASTRLLAKFAWRVKFGAAAHANSVIAFGLTDAHEATNCFDELPNANPPISWIKGFAFRANSNTGTGNFYAVAGDGTDEHELDTGIAPSGEHDFEIDILTDEYGVVVARYFVDGVFMVEYTSDAGTDPVPLDAMMRPAFAAKNHGATGAVLDIMIRPLLICAKDGAAL